MKECSGGAEDKEDEDDEEFSWQVEQEVYVETSEEELRGLQKYGFGNQRSGVFARLQVGSVNEGSHFQNASRHLMDVLLMSWQDELSDVVDVRNPDGTSAAERRQARLQAEASAFSPDHYL